MIDQTLIRKAEEFHGHICPFLILGLRASEIAMQKLGITKANVKNTIDEEILAIVECNNCFADGIQIATGCTFGNNSLIYLDVGKNAVTLVRRGEWRGIRVYLDSEKIKERYFSREVMDLFDKVVRRRVGSIEDTERLHKMWSEIGLSMVNAPEEFFKVEEVRISEIERAPIFESIRCEICGELTMKTRIRIIDGKTICLSCFGECNAVVGRGIIPNFKIPLEGGRSHE